MGQGHPKQDHLLKSIFHNNFQDFQENLKKIPDLNKPLSFSSKLGKSFGLARDVDFPILHLLVNYSRKEMILYLISEKVVKVDMQDEFGFTALMRAVQTGKEDLVELLLNNGADPLKPNQFDSGDSALHYACEAGDLKTILVLLSFFPDVNIKNSEGLTPLMYAVQRKHLKIVKTLIKVKANPFLTDSSGCSAFDYARSHRFNEKELKVLEADEKNCKKNDSNDTFISLTERSFVEDSRKTESFSIFITRGLDLLNEQVSWVR
jgi:ankyrin repeat protein